ncbi:MAG: hypothetical protein GY821_13420 [Gammaproteobacteria bacterium]|nr:hypothetical protein [Gammaproteobacteria bacterium]
MANTKVDKMNVSNDPFAQKPLLQGNDNQQQLIKDVEERAKHHDDINTKIAQARKDKDAKKIAPATLTDPQLSKGNQNNYVAKAEKELQREANIKKFKEKQYERKVSEEIAPMIVDDEQDVEKSIENFVTAKITQEKLAIKEDLDEDKKKEDKKKEQAERQEIEKEIKEEQEKGEEIDLPILEKDDKDLLEKEKTPQIVGENAEKENKEFYTTAPTPKPGMFKPSKEIEELLKQGGDNLNNLLQKTGDDAGKILKENIAVYNAFHQEFLNEPDATKRDGLVQQMQDNIQSNPIADNTINANMNHIANDVVEIYDGLRRGDVPTNEPGIV